MADETPKGQETPKPEEKKVETPAAEVKPAEGEAKPVEKKPTETPGDEGKGGDGKPVAETAPEKYDLALPEGSPFAQTDLEGFAAEAKAMGLTNTAAQAMVNARAEQIAQAATRYLDELKADPELGGDKLDSTIAVAAKGRDVLFPPGSEEAALISDWFERTGLGNHKLLVRAFHRLGKMVAEDKVITQRATGRIETDAIEKLYGGKAD